MLVEAVFLRRSRDFVRRQWIARKYGAWKQESHPAGPEEDKAPAETIAGDKRKRRRSAR